MSAGSEKLASQVARKIEDQIIDRRWPVGEVLGSETELLEQFGVSRSVLREAIRLLEHLGVARMRSGPGGGLVVCAPSASSSSRALVIYLQYIGISTDDLLQARVLLEPLAARLAAGAVTEEGIDALREIVRKEQAQELGQEWVGGPNAVEDDLHVALGRMSGNAVLQLFIEVVALLTARNVRSEDYPEMAVLAPAQSAATTRHAEIADAVITGDTAAAEIRLSRHLDEVRAWMLSSPDRRRSGRMRTRPTDPTPDTSVGRKLAEVIAGRIHNDITGDGWQIGEVFGSEPDLLARYGVSRAVLRESIRILEHHSVARMRRGAGGGLVVLAPDPSASIRAIALYLDFEEMSPVHLHVVRESIELGCVQAATGAAAQDPEAAARLRASLGSGTGAGAASNFHTELAAVADNPVLALFLRIIMELWARHCRTKDLSTIAADAEVRQAHGNILEAVLAGDDGLAQHRMRRHLQELAVRWD
ncbi:FadR/GntR family transcriptional regulator [Tomitella biformata]|uniref:FadR/GntR family transcriptional regulator n=1 Tax=Tomitella biformata TaxID=630403 RepID=UPI00046552A4|nr:FCD domain-containing protein [Tomitella biformata]